MLCTYRWEWDHLYEDTTDHFPLLITSGWFWASLIQWPHQWGWGELQPVSAAHRLGSVSGKKLLVSFCDAPVAEVNLWKPGYLWFVLHWGSGRCNRPSEVSLSVACLFGRRWWAASPACTVAGGCGEAAKPSLSACRLSVEAFCSDSSSRLDAGTWRFTHPLSSSSRWDYWNLLIYGNFYWSIIS